jgi:hypothetical protein
VRCQATPRETKSMDTQLALMMLIFVLAALAVR